MSNVEVYQLKNFGKPKRKKYQKTDKPFRGNPENIKKFLALARGLIPAAFNIDIEIEKEREKERESIHLAHKEAEQK